MKRKLSTVERVFWLESETFPVNDTTIARIKHSFSIEQLKAVLSKLKARNPLLAVRIVVDNETEASFTSEGVAEVPIRVVEGLSDDEWVRVAEEELIKPFIFEKGPLIRVVWLKSEEVSHLIVTTNHSVTDGMGCISLIRDMLYLLAEPERELSPLPELPMFSDLIPSSLTNNPSFWQQAEELAAVFEAGSSLPSYEEVGVSHELSQKPRFSILLWELGKEQTSAMQASCQAEGTTVHSAICVAFLQAYAEVVADGNTWTRQLSSSINLRHYLSRAIGENWGVFASLISTTIDCSPKREFWEIARDLLQKLMGELTEEKLFMLPVATKLATESKSHDDLRKTLHYLDDDDMVVSNLGVVKFPEQYDSLSLESLYFAGSAIECPLLTIAVFDGRTFFSFAYSNFIMNSATGKQLKEKAMQYLAKAVG